MLQPFRWSLLSEPGSRVRLRSEPATDRVHLELDHVTLQRRVTETKAAKHHLTFMCNTPHSGMFWQWLLGQRLVLKTRP